MEISEYIGVANAIYCTGFTHQIKNMDSAHGNPFENDYYARDNYGIIVPEEYRHLWLHQKTRAGQNNIFKKKLTGQGISLTGGTIIDKYRPTEENKIIPLCEPPKTAPPQFTEA